MDNASTVLDFVPCGVGGCMSCSTLTSPVFFSLSRDEVKCAEHLTAPVVELYATAR